MKKHSIKDVARLAKVSTATVSRVINDSTLVDELTKERVLSVIKKLQYYPDPVARSLIKGKTNLLTLIVPPEPNFFAAFYFTQTLCGISEALTEQHYRFMIYQPEGYDFQEGYPPHLEEVRTDGIFIIAPLVNDRLVKYLESEKFPAVLVNAHSSVLDWVDLDNGTASSQVVEELAQMGHKKIGFIGGSLGYNTLARLDGYKKTLKKLNLPQEESWIAYGDYSLSSGQKAAAQLFSLENRPTALFVGNDAMAIGAMRAAIEKGYKVPEDISIFGFDDADVAQLSQPPLSTFKQPFYEMGKRAGEILIARIENPNHSQNCVELQGEIVRRESAAPIQ